MTRICGFMLKNTIIHRPELFRHLGGIPTKLPYQLKSENPLKICMAKETNPFPRLVTQPPPFCSSKTNNLHVTSRQRGLQDIRSIHGTAITHFLPQKMSCLIFCHWTPGRLFKVIVFFFINEDVHGANGNEKKEKVNQ